MRDRDEAADPRRLALQVAAVLARELDEGDRPGQAPHPQRHHEPAALPELGGPRRGDVPGPGGHHHDIDVIEVRDGLGGVGGDDVHPCRFRDSVSISA
jgi:hypothetical protein